MITSPDPAPVRTTARAAERAVAKVPEASGAGRVFGDFVEEVPAGAPEAAAGEAETQPQPVQFPAAADLVAKIAGEEEVPDTAWTEREGGTEVSAAAAVAVAAEGGDGLMLDAAMPVPAKDARGAAERSAGFAMPGTAATPAAMAVPGEAPDPEQPASDGDPEPPASAAADVPSPPSPAEPRAAASAPAPAQLQASADMALKPLAIEGWRLAPAQTETPSAPPAGPSASVAAASSARDVAGQITLVIGQTAQRDIEIRLDPPELGRVQIQLNPHEGGLQALVLADRPETQDFLRRHGDMLVRDLEEAGYGQVSLDFAAGEEAPRRDAPGFDRRFAPVPGIAADPAAAILAPPPRRAAGDGLDIRI